MDFYDLLIIVDIFVFIATLITLYIFLIFNLYPRLCRRKRIKNESHGKFIQKHSSNKKDTLDNNYFVRNFSIQKMSFSLVCFMMWVDVVIERSLNEDSKMLWQIHFVMIFELAFVIASITFINLRPKLVTLTIYIMYWIFIVCWGSYMIVNNIPINAA